MLEKLFARKSPPSPDGPVSLYGLRDYAQTSLHMAMSAGMVALAGRWVGAVTMLAGAALAGIATFAVEPRLSNPTLPPKQDRRPKGIEADLFSRAIASFSRRVGLVEPVSVIVDEDLSQGRIPGPNASVFVTKPPTVSVAPSLLKLLDSKEATSTAAHEVAHLGARHLVSASALDFLRRTATFGTTLAAGQALYLKQGLLVPAILGIGAGATSLIVYRTMKRDEDDENRKGLKGRQQLYRTIGNTIYPALSNAALLITHPISMLPAVAHRVTVYAANKLIKASFLRRQEFQADRAVGKLGADPVALITALRKRKATTKRDYPGAYSDYREGPIAERCVTAALSLFKCHPDVERRCRRLAALAARNGEDAGRIVAALKGKIDISALPPRNSRSVVDRSAGGGMPIGNVLYLTPRLRQQMERPAASHNDPVKPS